MNDLRTADVAAALASPEPEPRGQTLTDVLGELVGHAERGEPIVETLACGLLLLDETTGGLVRGEYLGVIAGPGLGKSTLADRLIVNALRRQPDARGLIFNLETSTPVRVARLVAGDAVRFDGNGAVSECIPLSALLRGQLDSLDRLRETAQRLMADVGGRLVFIDDASGAGEIADLIGLQRPDLVVIDHLGLVHAEGSSATEQTDAALAAIHAALRTTNAAGLLITEVNKVALSSGTVDLSGVRGSARFGSLAGQLIAVARDNGDEARDPLLRLRLLKNRHGRAYVEQTCQLFGGLGHLHFGPEVEPIRDPKRKPGKAGDDGD
jgi:replicative DNA helicase